MSLRVALSKTSFTRPSLSECYKYAAYDALGRWLKPDRCTADADGS
jgi:hypothetical protein